MSDQENKPKLTDASGKEVKPAVPTQSGTSRAEQSAPFKFDPKTLEELKAKEKQGMRLAGAQESSIITRGYKRIRQMLGQPSVNVPQAETDEPDQSQGEESSEHPHLKELERQQKEAEAGKPGAINQIDGLKAKESLPGGEAIKPIHGGQPQGKAPEAKAGEGQEAGLEGGGGGQGAENRETLERPPDQGGGAGVPGPSGQAPSGQPEEPGEASETGQSGGGRPIAGGRLKQVQIQARKAITDRLKKLTEKLKWQAIKKLAIFLASQWWFWLIVVIVIIVILMIVTSVGLYGASASSPNSAGKSTPQSFSPLDDKHLLQQLIAESNIANIENVLQNQKALLLTELDDLEKEINSNNSFRPQAATSIPIIEELKTLVNAPGSGNGQKFKDKLTELYKLWAPTVNSLKGTALPIKLDEIQGFGGTNHGSTMIRPEFVGGHNAFFGCSERGDKCHGSNPTTADAVDLAAKFDTQIYAPFSGHWTYGRGGRPDAIELIGQSSDGHKMEAILAHLTPTGGQSSGDITFGQPIGKLHHLIYKDGSDHPHLHFELRVDGKDIHRNAWGRTVEQCSEAPTCESLWDMQKIVLSGGA